MRPLYRKTVLCILVLTALAGATATLFLTFHREPVHKGKTWSQWLADVNYGQPEATRKEAAKAISEIGTNLLPRLVADLRGSRFDVWKWRTAVLLKKQSLVKFTFTTPDDRARSAAWAFAALGSAARPAAPELLRLFDSCPGYALSAYAAVLGPEAIPVLASRLTSSNEWVRWNAASALSGFSHEATKDAIPFLVKGLNDPSRNVRARMGLVLRELAPAEYESATQTNH
jgi:hypothetical protein